VSKFQAAHGCPRLGKAGPTTFMQLNRAIGVDEPRLAVDAPHLTASALAMSYILDALRRADAERERGAVPSLQSQQHTVSEDDAALARPRSLVGRSSPSRSRCRAARLELPWRGRAAARCAHRRVGSRRRGRPAADASAGARRADRGPCRPCRPALGARHAATAPRCKPLPRRPPVANRRRRRRERLPSTAARPRPPPATRRCRRRAAAPAAAEPRVHSQAELPEDIRRDLPKIVIGGSSYSGDAASRMVMINGQVFHEGDRLAPDLVLERIRLKSAVLPSRAGATRCCSRPPRPSRVASTRRPRRGIRVAKLSA
jgi:general secretion pathway protein B